MIKILEAAKYFVYLSYKSNFSLTPLKIQKLLYLAQGWSFVWDDQALFYSDFEAWQFGPVNYEVYNYFKKYGGNEIPKTESVNKVSNFKAKETIEAIWNIYGSYNAFKLVEITHNQTPWQYAYQNDTIITSDMIKKYFKSKY